MRPGLAFAPTVVTSTHLSPPAVIDITGVLTGTRIIRKVDVSVGSASGQAILAAPASRNAMTATWSFPWPLGQDPLPDGVQVAAVITGTRPGQQPVVETAQLTVDVAPPGPVALTMEAGGQPVAPGDTLRAAAPELRLSWPAATDGSGVAGYLARWNANSGGATTPFTQTVEAGGRWTPGTRPGRRSVSRSTWRARTASATPAGSRGVRSTQTAR